MKNKKLLAAIVAVTMSATTAVAFAGCDTDKHTHEYTDWIVTTPPTCTEAGVETGTCKADGATSTRPVDPTGHNYGDWQIVAPSAAKAGSATKICANGDHPINVTLPVLGTAGAYQVQQIKDEPTYTQNKYTHVSDEGNIVFTVDEAKENVTLTTAQAVQTVSDSKYVSLVGKGEGYYSDYGEQHPFLYEYGNNYTHIKDENAVEYDFEFWGEKDAQDNISGVVYKDWNYNWVDEDSAVYYNGMLFTSPIVLEEEKYQGIENLLAALFAAANTPVDYDTEFSSDINEGKYSFSWTNYSQTYNGYMNDDETDYAYLNIIDSIKLVTVEFTFDANYMLDSFKLTVDSYNYEYNYMAGDTLDYTYDDTTDTFIPKADANLSFDYDATTKTYSVKDGASYDVRNEIVLTQTALKDIEELPVNEFKRDEVSISSFKLMQNVGNIGYTSIKEVTKAEWDAISDNDPTYVKSTMTRYEEDFITPYTAYILYKRVESGVTLSGTTANGVTLVLDDITPESALEYFSLNPARAYLIENGKETLIYSNNWQEQDQIPEEYTDWMTQKDYLQASFGTDQNDDGEIIARFFTLRSEKLTGDFNVKLTFGEAEFNLTYHVDVATPDSVSTDVKVYNEVTNNYTVKTSDSATVYVGQKLTFNVNAGAPNGETYAVDDRATATLADGTVNATLTATEDGYTFAATEAGEYTINVKSLANEEATCTLTVTVEAAPDVTAILTGNYSAGKFSISFNDTDNTVTVSDDADVNETFGYTYENGVLTATSNDGNYSIVLTENYKLALVSKDEFGETNWWVFKAPESAGLKAVRAALAGSWSGSFGGSNSIVLTFADDTVEYSGGGMPVNLNYQITDNGNNTYSITFELLSGDEYYFTYYCWYGLSAQGPMFTVTDNTVDITEFNVTVFNTETGYTTPVTVERFTSDY